jgi:glycosyltransferase involved in cell wall biosynthesis
MNDPVDSAPTGATVLPRVQVLLATCNGASFIEAQLASVMTQRDVDVSLLVADDDSTDGTIELIRAAADRAQLDIVVRERPLGLPHTFLDLLARASVDHGYFAFCDQDDVWDADKLATAVAALRRIGDDQPALWTCRYRLIDSAGDALTDEAVPKYRYRPGLGNALVENLGPGCCMVWNRALQTRLAIAEPHETVMHDVWLYLSAAALGVAICDPAPLVGYRQHGHNAIGHGQTFRQRLRQVRDVRHGSLVSRETQAAAVLRHYGDHLVAADRAVTSAIATGSRWARAHHWFRGDVWRHERRDNLLLLARLVLLRHRPN